MHTEMRTKSLGGEKFDYESVDLVFTVRICTLFLHHHEDRKTF
jgi:hypothetical protein